VCGEMKRTEHGKKTPVVVVTSVYKGRKYRSQAIHQHGADDYLEKPIAPEVLTKTVDGLLPDGPGREKPVASTPAPVPVAAAPRTVATTTRAEESVAAKDATEAEIVEHLNEILGDPTGGSGSAG
jgi:DNA-binding response OmpR family regulator